LKKIIFNLFLLLFSTQGFTQNCTGTITGHVVDADTKVRLAGASVSVPELNYAQVTDSKGDFKFNGICDRKLTIIVTHIDCETFTTEIDFKNKYHVDVAMPHARETLGDVYIEAQRKAANEGFVKQLSKKELEQSKGLNLSQALSKINGVTILQTGSTIAKPILHGLHSTRVLTINNGVKQEGQQWGNEHAPEIDPFIAGKLSVVKGVDELQYGSDAIGGVVIVEPKKLRTTAGTNGEINVLYGTNNRQQIVSGNIEQQLKSLPGFTYRLQSTIKRSADVHTANYSLNNTAAKEANFSITTALRKKKIETELYYSYFTTKLGIFTGSHIGNLTDLLEAIAAEKPNDIFLNNSSYKIGRPRQEVLHQLLKSTTTLKLQEHKITLQIAAQNNDRSEFDIVRRANNTKPQINLVLNTLSEDLIYEHPKMGYLTGKVGVSLMQQSNSYRGRYFIPNYTANNAGVFWIEKWQKHQWKVQAGIRGDVKNIDTRRIKSGGDTVSNNFNFKTFASSGSVGYDFSSQWSANLGISLSARAPYVNELLSDGIHHGTATYERGNIELVPEKSTNISLGLTFKNEAKTFESDLLLYNNNINAFIYERPRPESPVLTIAGAFPLIEYTSTNAQLMGVDHSFQWKIIPGNLTWINKTALIFARDKKMNDWLINIPAQRFTNQFAWDFKDGQKLKESSISVEMNNVLRQTRIPDPKNAITDYKDPPPGYTLIGLEASTTIRLAKTPITIATSVHNLLNNSYREYLNSFRYYTDEMGRNITLKATIHF
jgi:iron complex outermembrane receptor protein